MKISMISDFPPVTQQISALLDQEDMKKGHAYKKNSVTTTTEP